MDKMSVEEEEWKLIVEQAMRSVLGVTEVTAHDADGEAQACETWLLESPLHVRETLVAMALMSDPELRQLLDPQCQIDADALARISTPG